jgi:DNA-binding MarR family transcriptional regulator
MSRRKNLGAPMADPFGQQADPPTLSRKRPGEAAPGPIDTSYLEGLIGYNARRAALTVIAVFLERMKPYGLRPVEFSTLSLITHNPGVTARQLCHALGVLPPNMRRPHPSDRRAQGLHLSEHGQAMMQAAERTAAELEQDAAHRLSAAEQKTLMGLLQKIYR